MKIISLNIGLPKTVIYNGRSVTTGIYKYPTENVIRLLEEKLEGDGQADPRFHGGEHKSVYSYPDEHYAFWKKELGRNDLEVGMFGENLTTEGLLEHEVFIGDRFQLGNCILEATQPRLPCFKLGLRFQDAKMPKYFLREARNGIYFKVVEQGALQKGNTIQLMQRSVYDITIKQIAQAYAKPYAYMDLVKEIVKIPILPPKLRPDFTKVL